MLTHPGGPQVFQRALSLSRGLCQWASLELAPTPAPPPPASSPAAGPAARAAASPASPIGADPAWASGGHVPPLPVLFQDDHMLAVLKPPGLMVHFSREAPREERESGRFVKDLAEALHHSGEPLFPVHRLDRGTSGVLVLGKSSGSCSQLQQAMGHPLCAKEYLVLCRGHPPEDMLCDEPLKDERGISRMAETELTLIRHFPHGRCSLALAKIRTGRRHQIRRHLNLSGFHVLGDSAHGKGRDNKYFREHYKLPPSRMFLHSSALSLPVLWPSNFISGCDEQHSGANTGLPEQPGQRAETPALFYPSTGFLGPERGHSGLRVDGYFFKKVEGESKHVAEEHAMRQKGEVSARVPQFSLKITASLPQDLQTVLDELMLEEYQVDLAYRFTR